MQTLQVAHLVLSNMAAPADLALAVLTWELTDVRKLAACLLLSFVYAPGLSSVL